MVPSQLFEPSLAPDKCPEALVPPSVGRVVLALPRVVWLYLMLAASALMLRYSPSLWACGAALALTVLTLCAGHSVGLHRGIIHKTYSCPGWLRGALAYAFVQTGIGGPVATGLTKKFSSSPPRSRRP